MNIDTGREFDFPNPQDDADMYPTPPLGFRLDYTGNLRADWNPPQVSSNVDPLVARLEAQISRLTADLQRAKEYIIRLGGQWPGEWGSRDLI